MSSVEITLGHSPDPDDAFMFYALAADKIETEGLKFTHIIQDIETLNQRALRAELDGWFLEHFKHEMEMMQ